MFGVFVLDISNNFRGWAKQLFIILFILTSVETLGSATTRENDSFTESVVYDNNNNITDNFPNEFVLAANIDGKPHNKDFNAKCD